jgi:HK97 family phage portal protein
MNLKFWKKSEKEASKKIVDVLTKAAWDWALAGYNTVHRGIAEDILDSDNPYVKIWVAYKCIDLIASNIAAIPISLRDKADKIIKEDRAHNLLFVKPNNYQSANDLMYGAVTYFHTNGNSYIMNTGTPERPLELWLLNSSKIEPISGGKDEPLIKKYKNLQGRDYEPEEICHTKTFNPDSMIKGMPVLKPLEKEIAGFGHMADFQVDSFKNGILPKLHFHSKSDIMPDEVYQGLSRKIEQQLLKQFIVTYGDLDADTLSFTPNDMNLIGNYSQNAAAIATTLGVPAEMLGAIIEKKNVATYKESRKQFYEDKLLPTTQIFLDKFNMYFYPDGSRKLTPELDQIKALKRDFSEIKESWWLTPNQKLEQMGLPRSEDPAMDIVYIPSGFVPLDQLSGEKEEFPKKL